MLKGSATTSMCCYASGWQSNHGLPAAQVHTELKFTYADATKRCASLPDLHKIRNASSSELLNGMESFNKASDNGTVLRSCPGNTLDVDFPQGYFGYFKDERHPVSKEPEVTFALAMLQPDLCTKAWPINVYDTGFPQWQWFPKPTPRFCSLFLHFCDAIITNFYHALLHHVFFYPTELYCTPPSFYIMNFSPPSFYTNLLYQQGFTPTWYSNRPCPNFDTTLLRACVGGCGSHLGLVLLVGL